MLSTGGQIDQGFLRFWTEDVNAEKIITLLGALSDILQQQVVDYKPSSTGTSAGTDEASSKEHRCLRIAAGHCKSAQSQYAMALTIEKNPGSQFDSKLFNRCIDDCCSKYWPQLFGENQQGEQQLCALIKNKDCMLRIQSFLDSEAKRFEEAEIKQHRLVRADSAAARAERCALHFHAVLESLGYISKRPGLKIPLVEEGAIENKREWEEQIIGEIKAEASFAAQQEGLADKGGATHGDINSKLVAAAMNYCQCLAAERGDEPADKLYNRIHKTRFIDNVGSEEHRIQLGAILEKEFKVREKAYGNLEHGSAAAHCRAAADDYQAALTAMRVKWEGKLAPKVEEQAEWWKCVKAPVGALVSDDRVKQQNAVLSLLKADLSALIKQCQGRATPDSAYSHLSTAENHYAKAVSLDRMVNMETIQKAIHAGASSATGTKPTDLKRLRDMLMDEAKRMTDEELRAHGYVSGKGKAFYAQKAADEFAAAVNLTAEE